MRYFLFILILVFSFFCNGATVRTGLLCTTKMIRDNCADTTNAYFTSCCQDGLTCADRPCERCCNKMAGAVQPCLWNTTKNKCEGLVCSDTSTCSSHLNGFCCNKTPTCHWTYSRWCRAKCPATTQYHCILEQANPYEEKQGKCESGYNGSCKYLCHGSASYWHHLENSCERPDKSCRGYNAFHGNCITEATPHGESSGQCGNGYTGSCSIRCNNGSWDYNMYRDNNCVLAPRRQCTSGTQTDTRIIGGKCILPLGYHDWTVVGKCKNRRYKGSCSYKCNDGTWSYVSTTCAKARDCYSRKYGTQQHGQVTPGGGTGFIGQPGYTVYVVECRDGTYFKITPENYATYRTITGNPVTFTILSDGSLVTRRTIIPPIDY